MVLPEAYKNELCKDFEQKMVTRVLLNVGWISPAPDGKATQVSLGLKGWVRPGCISLRIGFGEGSKSFKDLTLSLIK
ncbi:hypothetical protein N750_08565 [Legionella pneumophila str. Leg01/53]|nr:hypothetical protein N750_08565 [Legionella pneumophila str. Leg01/53]